MNHSGLMERNVFKKYSAAYQLVQHNDIRGFKSLKQIFLLGFTQCHWLDINHWPVQNLAQMPVQCPDAFRNAEKSF